MIAQTQEQHHYTSEEYLEFEGKFRLLFLSWVSDPRYLLALLTYSTFMNKMDMEPLVAVANKVLQSAPVVKL